MIDLSALRPPDWHLSPLICTWWHDVHDSTPLLTRRAPARLVADVGWGWVIQMTSVICSDELLGMVEVPHGLPSPFLWSIPNPIDVVPNRLSHDFQIQYLLHLVLQLSFYDLRQLRYQLGPPLNLVHMVRIQQGGVEEGCGYAIAGVI
jgi:hypothetical protein